MTYELPTENLWIIKKEKKKQKKKELYYCYSCFFNQLITIGITIRVQGVFYRATMRDVALELGLNGWVKNRYDGGVEATIEGDVSQVGEIIKWCKIGPPAASVTDVKVVEQEASEELDGFSIIY